MSGHSHWSGIKHKKGITDQKRGKLFSKLLRAVTIAAREETNPEFNAQLRNAIQKAKEGNVPADKIKAAISRASEKGDVLEVLLFEAYGPGGIAIIIEAVSDNSNRTIPEIKKILSDGGGKWAESGSVQWSFEKTEKNDWKSKFPQSISKEDNEKLDRLIVMIIEHDDVQNVFTNIKI